MKKFLSIRENRKRKNYAFLVFSVMAATFKSLTVNFEQSVRSHMPREKSASIITVSPTAAIPINNEKQKFLQYLI
jgi:hypothetical protein